MLTAATHDSPRLSTSFDNKGGYKMGAYPNDYNTYQTGKPRKETYDRVRLYLMHQFTIPGSPQIWNGDEMGMWGADDPDCRKPLWWPEYDFEDEYRNNFQPGEKVYDEVGFNIDMFNFYREIISIRNDNPVLAHGDIEFMMAEGNKLMYKRFDDKDEIIAIFNMEDEAHAFKIPNKNYKNLLGDNTFVGMITVPAKSGLLLKKM